MAWSNWTPPLVVLWYLVIFSLRALSVARTRSRSLVYQPYTRDVLYYIGIFISTQRRLRPIQFAQELLSTFSTSLGEVSLVPSTGGVFTIDIVHAGSPSDPQAVSQEGQLTTQTSRLWDRKTEGGFPGM